MLVGTDVCWWVVSGMRDSGLACPMTGLVKEQRDRGMESEQRTSNSDPVAYNCSEAWDLPGEAIY